MYTLAESLTVVFATLAVAGLFFLVAVIVVSIKELGVRLGNTPLGIAMMGPLALNSGRPTGSSGGPIEPDSLVAVTTPNPEVHMKKKWYRLFLDPRDDHEQQQQSAVGASSGPKSALDPLDCDAGIAAIADAPPTDTSLLEEYRGQVTTRSTGEYTILKIAQMLQSEHIRYLSESAKRGAILVALQAAGVKVTDVVDDALQRNEVLANAELAREKALREFETRKEEANRKVQAMVQSLVADYDARIRRTKEEVSAERDKLAEWKRTKTEEERKIADALAYLVDKDAPSA